VACRGKQANAASVRVSATGESGLPYRERDLVLYGDDAWAGIGRNGGGDVTAKEKRIEAPSTKEAAFAQGFVQKLLSLGVGVDGVLEKAAEAAGRYPAFRDELSIIDVEFVKEAMPLYDYVAKAPGNGQV
jgi:hypothetical protein